MDRRLARKQGLRFRQEEIGPFLQMTRIAFAGGEGWQTVARVSRGSRNRILGRCQGRLMTWSSSVGGCGRNRSKFIPFLNS